MFKVNEVVVYPGQGVARVTKLVEKGGSPPEFLELTFMNNNVTVLVPSSGARTIGIRSLSSCEYMASVIGKVSATSFCKNHTRINWSKRSKEYQAKIMSGKLSDILEVYRDLRKIAAEKGLSFGEKGLLFRTEALLAEEISLASNCEENMAVEFLRTRFV